MPFLSYRNPIILLTVLSTLSLLAGCGKKMQPANSNSANSPSSTFATLSACLTPLVADAQILTANPQPNQPLSVQVTASGCNGLFGVYYAGLETGPTRFTSSTTLSITLPSGNRQLLIQVFAYDTSGNIVDMKNVTKTITVGGGGPVGTGAFGCIATPGAPAANGAGIPAVRYTIAPALVDDTRPYRVTRAQAYLLSGGGTPVSVLEPLPSPAGSSHSITVQFAQPGSVLLAVNVVLDSDPVNTYTCVTSFVEVRPPGPTARVSLNNQPTNSISIPWNGKVDVAWVAENTSGCTLFSPEQAPLAAGIVGYRQLSEFPVSYTQPQNFVFELACYPVTPGQPIRFVFTVAVGPRPDKVTALLIDWNATLATYRVTLGVDYVQGRLDISGWGIVGQGGRITGRAIVMKPSGNSPIDFSCDAARPSEAPSPICRFPLPGVWGMQGSRVPYGTVLPLADGPLREFVNLSSKGGIIRFDCGPGAVCINIDTRTDGTSNGFALPPARLGIDFGLF